MQNYLSVGLGTFSTDLLPNLDNGNKVIDDFRQRHPWRNYEPWRLFCRRDVWHSMCADRISRSSDARRNQSSMPSVPKPLPIQLMIPAIMVLKELAKDGVRSMHAIFISFLTVSVTGTGSLLRRFSFCWSFVNLKGSPWLERALSWNVMLNLRRSSG